MSLSGGHQLDWWRVTGIWEKTAWLKNTMQALMASLGTGMVGGVRVLHVENVRM